MAFAGSGNTAQDTNWLVAAPKSRRCRSETTAVHFDLIPRLDLYEIKNRL